MVRCMCVCVCVFLLVCPLPSPWSPHGCERTSQSRSQSIWEASPVRQREGVDKVGGGVSAELSWTASQRHTSPEWHGGKDRERLCLYKGDDNCSQFTQTSGTAVALKYLWGCWTECMEACQDECWWKISWTAIHVRCHHNWVLTSIYSHTVLS